MPKLWIAFVVALAPSFIHARPPMIEVGGGVHADNHQVNVLVRLGFDGVPVATDSAGGFYIARIQANAGISRDVPYLDVDFTPVSVDYRRNEDRAIGALGAAGHLIPINVRRDVAIGRDVSVRVSVVGVSAELPIEGNRDYHFYARIVADLLGFKAARFTEADLAGFDGIHLGRLGGEIGVDGGWSENFKIRVAVGAVGEGAIGLDGSGLMDGRAYAQLTTEIYQLVRVFVEGSLVGSSLSNGDRDREWATWRVSSGISIVF